MSLGLPDDNAAAARSSETDLGGPIHADRTGRPLRAPKTLVLTGASRGIGRATGKLFLEAGWRVISYVRQPFDAVRCPWDSEDDSYISVDLSEHRTLPRVIAEIKVPGRRTAARTANNAENSPKTPNGTQLTSLATSAYTWMSVFHLNLVAPILLAQGLLEELKAASGSIVNVTSITGPRAHPFAGTAYASSKAALACLTRERAHDYASHGIRANAIAPGEIKTDIMSPDTEAHFVRKIPLWRVVHPRRSRRSFSSYVQMRQVMSLAPKCRSMADNTCE
uniref:Nitrogen fixation protein FixR n=1 Tax=Bradyrhizobium sp. (strain WM9) TaxID=133505 RepID=Q9AQ15_BRASW|nr:nitrogen fixation protein FixR [Bradyrhizobium sp. WM9]